MTQTQIHFEEQEFNRFQILLTTPPLNLTDEERGFIKYMSNK